MKYLAYAYYIKALVNIRDNSKFFQRYFLRDYTYYDLRSYISALHDFNCSIFLDPGGQFVKDAK